MANSSSIHAGSVTSPGEPAFPVRAPYSYELPDDRIAQRPVVPYDTARLLIIDRTAGTLRDSNFTAVAEELSEGDLLVFNDTRVLPARFFGTFRTTPDSSRGNQSAISDTAANVEVLLIRPDPVSPRWRCIGKPLKRFTEGRVLDFVAGPLLSGLSATVVARVSSEEVTLEFSTASSAPSLEELMQTVGQMPIPPYIRGGHADEADRADYQTMFAKISGSIAAPTASLHFTPELISRIRQKGVRVECLTLHVGAASIRRVERDGEITAPQPESMIVPRAVLESIAETKLRKGRVIAVGTTVTRALESALLQNHSAGAASEDTASKDTVAGEADIFITPGFEFKALSGLFTNFHQPGTTHLMLVEAFMGRALLERSYAHALENGYRFLSYGDGTLIL